MDQKLKERFFAQYFGQKVLHMDDESNLEYIFPIVKSTFFATNKGNYLLLRPISTLTDEEAIEYAKLQDYESPTEKDDFTSLRSQLRVSIKNQWLNFTTVDYLRSIGVALPFMGHSVQEMIDCGWIRLIEKD